MANVPSYGLWIWELGCWAPKSSSLSHTASLPSGNQYYQTFVFFSPEIGYVSMYVREGEQVRKWVFVK